MRSEFSATFFDVLENQRRAAFGLDSQSNRSFIYFCSHLAAIKDRQCMLEFAFIFEIVQSGKIFILILLNFDSLGLKIYEIVNRDVTLTE